MYLAASEDDVRQIILVETDTDDQDTSFVEDGQTFEATITEDGKITIKQ